MDRRTRVKVAINHKETDFTPYQVNFTGQSHDRVAQYLGISDFEETLGVHMELASVTGPAVAKEVEKELFLDEFNILWDRRGAGKDIGMMAKIKLREPDLAGLSDVPAPNEQFIRATVEKLLARKNDTFKVGRISMAMFERAWSLRGIENFLADMLLEPAFAEALLDYIMEYDLKILDIFCEYSELDGVYFGDDWGQQTPGLMMGPATWRKFIKPRMAKLYAKVKNAGKAVIQHSCGDNTEIFPDLIEIGLDVYNTFQPEIYDIHNIKDKYGRNLTIWGGISTQVLLPYATPEEVKKETANLIRVLGKGGGYIAGPTHWIPGDVPPENIMAMLEVLRHQEQYI